ncbi:killer cell lectin-like receptor subfamily B member 1 [Chionomys nivalis]|uniref:killer cell lectin-like receptor subfamily B member 1 n=1 Tax=Chionomys nivalis TaxID=269649 RepID=UPI002597F535|nr:killer cell lectin-like receptor subfamily B member 1 [Chionomys nivalis]
MDTSTIYATINFAEIQELRLASSSLPSDEEDRAVNNDGEDPAVHIYDDVLAVNNYTRQCPRRHWLTLKLGCAGLILVLIVIGISVTVGFLVQSPPRVNMTEPTGRSAVLTCPRDWHPYWDKCLFISQTTRSWVEGQADCSMRGSTLLVIENEEELKFIWDFLKRKSTKFYIGLNYVPAEKIWKWVNGSILNPDVLQITIKNEDNGCATISGLEVLVEKCSVYHLYICQKKLKPV